MTEQSPLERLDLKKDIALGYVKNKTAKIVINTNAWFGFDEDNKEAQSLKQQIEKALEKTDQRLTSLAIKWVYCKNCKKDYFGYYPNQKCVCGSFEFAEADALLSDLLQNQRTEQDKQNENKIKDTKQVIGWILDDIAKNNQTRDEIIIGLRKLHVDLPEDKTAKQNEQIVQKVRELYPKLDSALETLDAYECVHFNKSPHLLDIHRKIRKQLQQILGEKK